MNPSKSLKVLKKRLEKALEDMEVLEDVSWDYISFLKMERQLNDALGHNGDMCWNDMVEEVEKLRLLND